MITELTEEQKHRIKEYYEAGMEIGLSTVTSKEKSEEYISKLYEYFNYKKPKFIWCDSPLSMQYVIHVIKDISVEDIQSIGRSIYQSIDQSIRQSIRQSIDQSIRQSIWQSIRQSIEKSKIILHLGYYCYAQNEIFWIQYYIYCQSLGIPIGIKTEEGLDIMYNIAKYSGWWCPFENLCFVCHKPVKIKTNRNNMLHADGENAIEYKDGFRVWALNSVRVTKEIAETPWNELDSNLVLTEQNAEIRREIVRKIGIEKVCNDLGAKCLDKDGDYELLELKAGERTHRYLKMVNPSINTYHVEGVAIECETVEQALNFRKPEAMRRIPVSENGEEWYQQGDVCIWRKGAKFLKHRPKILT
jgi:hypothetical protein